MSWRPTPDRVRQWVPPWGRRFWLQRQRSVLDDTLHDEGRAEALDAWKGGEALVVELLVRRQVDGDDAQEVVGLAEEPLGFPDVGDGGDSLFEGVDGVAVSGRSASKVRPRALASRWAW